MRISPKVFMALIAVAAIAAGILLWQKPTKAPVVQDTENSVPQASLPTEGWLDFSDMDLGFVLKYPQGMVIEDRVVENDPADRQAMDMYFALGAYQFIRTTPPASFTLYVYRTSAKDLEEWLGAAETQAQNLVTVKDFTLDGKPAKEISSCGNSNSMETVVMSGNRVYEFQLHGTCADRGEASALETFRGVVSTFRNQ